jgi:putative flippase GtrA/ubiquinone/menaquinone biosynthesis C-methylase UbiE
VSRQFLRFAIVGSVGFVIDASILTLLVTAAGWHHYAARAVSFASAVTVTWVCNRQWVFAATANAGREYGGYFFTQGMGALINLGTYVVLIEQYPILSTVPVVPLSVGAGLALIFNFLVARHWVFLPEAKVIEIEPARVSDQSIQQTSYSGRENLEAMRYARNYNDYLLALVKSSRTGQRVLDFGAGAGTFAVPLAASGWNVTCLEPDADLVDTLRASDLPVFTRLDAVDEASMDFIYSFNVLEHIEDDQSVLERLHACLTKGGRLLLFVPAFECLYSAMDRKVGHFRRYRRQMLETQLRAAGFTIEASRYADSIGFLASLVYKYFGSRSGVITPSSVTLYDRYLFPLSRLLDRLASPFLGKNLMVIARK